LGLAARMLIATVGAVTVSMSIVFATRLEASRENWVHNKLMTVQAAIEAFDPGQKPLPAELAGKVLQTFGLESVAVLSPEGRREIATSAVSPGPIVDMTHDDSPYTFNPVELYRILFPEPDTIIRIRSLEPPLEVTLNERPLTHTLRRIARTLFGILVVIAVVVTFVVWATLWRMVLRPVRILTSNIIAFGERPQDVSRIIAPSGRSDEIGRAETALAAMEGSLAHELAQRKRLAELGIAVARINHDLRNMLSAAQLISDRLATIPDPLAQRLAPRLVATLDRAIHFCQATLTYGAGREQPPERRRIDLSELVHQVVESAEAEHAEAIDYHVDVPPHFEVYADPDHILRVLENLSRNAAQALIADGAAGERPKAIRFAAIRCDGVALIELSDTGPGIPRDQRERIFEPFHKTTNDVGAGLGLSIAADLVARNGGAIELAPPKADDFYCGARFLIKLPTPERATLSSVDALPET
jgi:signal transduction histidine kinase